jgi:hypothetical protein
MIDANEARKQWLDNRNPDLIAECESHIKQLIGNSYNENPAIRNETENIDLVFNTSEEFEVLRRFLTGLGYRIRDMQNNEGDPVLKSRIRIQL